MLIAERLGAVAVDPVRAARSSAQQAMKDLRQVIRLLMFGARVLDVRADRVCIIRTDLLFEMCARPLIADGHLIAVVAPPVRADQQPREGTKFRLLEGELPTTPGAHEGARGIRSVKVGRESRREDATARFLVDPTSCAARRLAFAPRRLSNRRKERLSGCTAARCAATRTAIARSSSSRSRRRRWWLKWMRRGRSSTRRQRRTK